MVRGTGGGNNRRLLNTSNPFQISIAKSSLRLRVSALASPGIVSWELLRRCRPVWGIVAFSVIDLGVDSFYPNSDLAKFSISARIVGAIGDVVLVSKRVVDGSKGFAELGNRVGKVNLAAGRFG